MPPFLSSSVLSFNKISQVYKNTTATYKFYWFISIVEMVSKEHKTLMSFWDIIVRMIANAWYPIHYFRISFGKADSLYDQIMNLQKITGLPIDASKETIINTLQSRINDPQVLKHLRIFTNNVPYRFLSPWFPQKSNTDIITLSQSFTNDCPYAIKDINGERHIEINPEWIPYFEENIKILLDYSYWNLTLFLQVRNPNVPDIANKLVKQIERNPLNKQRNYWKEIMDYIGYNQCIYTGRMLNKDHFDLDHFIPWSFVAHDQMWNLLPADPSINSSKSNKLPDLKSYLPKFAKIQLKAIKATYHLNPNNKLLEDYQALGPAVYDLVEMDESAFYEQYYKVISPMVQIASNMGYEQWIR